MNAPFVVIKEETHLFIAKIRIRIESLERELGKRQKTQFQQSEISVQTDFQKTDFFMYIYYIFKAVL